MPSPQSPASSPGSPKQTKAATTAAAAAASGSLVSSASSSTSDFTAEMRDRQARGKDPYRDSDSEDSDSPPAQGPGSLIGGGGGGGSSGAGNGSSSLREGELKRVGAPKRDEHFAVYDRRRMAAQILDSPELLIMAAMRDDASLPATRLKYTRVLCGVEEQYTLVSRPSSPPGAGTGAARSPGPDKQGKRPKQRSQPGNGGGS
ncbi:hypothetical protein F4825DRAFT_408190 [Nemania diffusa]|nr:hypothetical protein F4825DRAFT_408190 [Nemania diffusa]